MRHTLLGCVLATSFAVPVAAQFPGPGMTWTGTAGGSTGSYLPTCANLPVDAVRGDSVLLRIWGDPGSVFLLLTAGSANQCLPIPGIGNALMLDLPAFPVVAGVLTQLTPCLSCPPGYEPLPFVVPTSLPPGLVASFQSVGFGANQFAFTIAITATVQ